MTAFCLHVSGRRGSFAAQEWSERRTFAVVSFTHCTKAANVGLGIDFGALAWSTATSNSESAGKVLQVHIVDEPR